MSDDNLLAALSGVLEGISSVYVPTVLNRQKANLELELAKAKQPLELEKYRQEQAIKGKQDIQTEREIYGYEHPRITNSPSVPPIFRKQGLEGLTYEEGINALKLRQKDNKSISEQTKRRISDLQAVKSDINQIFEMSNKIDSGFVGGAERFTAKIPFIGPGMAPKTSEYEDALDQTSANLVRAFTGSNRPSNALKDAEKKFFPRPEDTKEVKLDKMKKLHQRIDSRIRLYSTGQIDETSDISGGISIPPFSGSSDQFSIHDQALEWANANPNDPRATAIKQKATKSKHGF